MSFFLFLLSQIGSITVFLQHQSILLKWCNLKNHSVYWNFQTIPVRASLPYIPNDQERTRMNGLVPKLIILFGEGRFQFVGWVGVQDEITTRKIWWCAILQKKEYIISTYVVFLESWYSQMIQCSEAPILNHMFFFQPFHAWNHLYEPRKGNINR